jgi:FMN reductase
MGDLRLAAVIGSPNDGRTGAAVDAVVEGALGSAQFQVDRILLGEERLADVPVRLVGANCFVVGTPMYRATFTGLLKDLLDVTPRGIHDDGTPPFLARPVAVVGTGASAHHFLGIDPLFSILSRFFGAYVVPPGFYADGSAFTPEGDLAEAASEQAHALGRSLGALALAVGASDDLAAAAPQI